MSLFASSAPRWPENPHFEWLERCFTSGYSFVGKEVVVNAEVPVSDDGGGSLVYDADSEYTLGDLSDLRLNIMGDGSSKRQGYFFEVQGHTSDRKPVIFTVGIGPYGGRFFIDSRSIDWSPGVQNETESMDFGVPSRSQFSRLPGLSQSLPPYSRAVAERFEAANSKRGIDDTRSLPGKHPQEDNPQRYVAEQLERSGSFWTQQGDPAKLLIAALSGEWSEDLQVQFVTLSHWVSEANKLGISGLQQYENFCQALDNELKTHLVGLRRTAKGYTLEPFQRQKR